MRWAAACLMLAAAVASWVAFVAAPGERRRTAERWREQLGAMADDRKADLDRWIIESSRSASAQAASSDVEALARAAPLMTTPRAAVELPSR